MKNCFDNNVNALAGCLPPKPNGGGQQGQGQGGDQGGRTPPPISQACADLIASTW
jgi:hypothetical protein